MIIVSEKYGNIHTAANRNRDIDIVLIEWHEARKRILHKQTKKGKQIALKFLNENPDLKDGDILFQDESCAIIVEINSCKCIVVVPRDLFTASSLCYEIGNRHLPLFYENDELLIPYDIPLYNLLKVSGYIMKVEERKLNRCFQTSVLPHLQVSHTDSLFIKTNQLTNSV